MSGLLGHRELLWSTIALRVRVPFDLPLCEGERATRTRVGSYSSRVLGLQNLQFSLTRTNREGLTILNFHFE
jgi:hypothetical protein